MKRLAVLLLMVGGMCGQTLHPGGTFVYPENYPQGCSGAEYENCTTPSIPLPTLGFGYVDPNLGHSVRIAGSSNHEISSYSAPTALSATGRYVALGKAGWLSVYDVATNKKVRDQLTPSQDWGWWWSAKDDDVYYAAKGGTIVRGSIATGIEVVAADAAAYFGIPGVDIRTGGTGDPSPDGYLPFWSFQAGQFGVADLNTGRIWAVPESVLTDHGLARSGFDFAMITKHADVKTGLYYILVELSPVVLTFDPVGGIKYGYTMPAHPSGPLWGHPDWNIANQFDHADTVSIPDPSGKGSQEFLFSWQEMEPCSATKQSYCAYYGLWRLAEGPDRILETEIRLSRNIRSNHYGCSSNGPYCVGAFSRNAHTDPATAFDSEAWVFDLSGILASKTFTVSRVLKHRSIWDRQYYFLPRVSIAPDGSRIAGSTNWGVTIPGSSAEAPTTTLMEFVADTNIGASTPPPSPPPPISVIITPGNARVEAGGIQQFAASVPVIWALSGPGTLTPEGLYTAPSIVQTLVQAIVSASAVSDPTRMAQAKVQLDAGVNLTLPVGQPFTIKINQQ